MSLNDLTKYAYVRYAEAAVEHLFAVASGLDSAVIGEQQVLGQVRRAYAAAEANQTVGRTLHELAQRALSVGKRVHSRDRHRRRRAPRWCRSRWAWPSAQLDGLAGRHRRRRRRGLDGRAVGQAPDAGGHRPGSRGEPDRCPGPAGSPHSIREQGVDGRRLSRSTTSPPCWPTPTWSSAAPVRCGRWSPWPTRTAACWARLGAAAAGDLRPRHAARRRPRGGRPARRAT